MRRSALAVTMLVAMSRVASAQPAPEVDMDPTPTPPPTDTPPTPPPAPTKDAAEAKKQLAAGAQAVQQGDYFKRINKPDDAKTKYEAALVAYAVAIQNSDDPNIYMQLAGVLEKLDQNVKAVAAYQVIMKATAPAVKPATQADAKKRIDDLMTKLGSVTLAITPDETSVMLDDAELAKSPLTEPLIFKPGTYKLVFVSIGYLNKEVEIQVEAGGEVEKKIELDPVPIVMTPKKPIVEDPVEKPKPYVPPSRLPLYIGAGATGVGLVTTIVTGALALHDHSVFVKGTSTDDQRFDARVNGHRAAVISDVALVGTVAAAGFTAGWYFFKYRGSHEKTKNEDRNPNAPKLDLIPWVDPDGGGLAAVGAF